MFPRSKSTDVVTRRSYFDQLRPTSDSRIIRRRPPECEADGLGTSSSAAADSSEVSNISCRTHLELRPASDGTIFPISHYPKRLPGGSATTTPTVAIAEGATGPARHRVTIDNRRTVVNVN